MPIRTTSTRFAVRQHWQSTDAEGQWTTAFDGNYTRVEAKG